MEPTYWHQQTSGKPLFDDVLWSRPEQRSAAGKLAVIGGNVHGFNSVSSAYATAEKAGIGTVKVLLPDTLSKAIGKLWEGSEFAPSNKSGGFSSKALDSWISLADWADACIVSGDLGHNSETAILLEEFIDKQPGFISLTGDSLTLMNSTPLGLINRDNLLLAPDEAQFQRLLTAVRYPTAYKSSATLFQVVDLLHSLTLSYTLAVVLIHDGQALIAQKGEVSSTPAKHSLLECCVICSVWRLQQPSKEFEAMTTAML